MQDLSWRYTDCLVVRQASAVVAHGLNYPLACGIFLDQGIEPMYPELVDGFLNHWTTRKVQYNLILTN